ncbi:MAG: hypothetical protein KME20_10215, partial [Kaiparowitsia implicata GSE-PSE-MK54-09C]|nr:hypothetical protein [Kaiparowitsia implicata GSE-PSE-MK54-09C]
TAQGRCRLGALVRAGLMAVLRRPAYRLFCIGSDDRNHLRLGARHQRHVRCRYHGGWETLCRSVVRR